MEKSSLKYRLPLNLYEEECQYLLFNVQTIVTYLESKSFSIEAQSIRRKYTGRSFAISDLTKGDYKFFNEQILDFYKKKD